MKSIFIIIVFIFSININAQSKIENDELFQNYKREYIKLSENRQVASDFDVKSQAFHEKMNSDKKRGFYKSKSKEKWLKKNFSKTGFQNLEAAEYAYTEMKRLEGELSNRGSAVKKLYEELLKKYDREVIFEAVRNNVWVDIK